jgi:uncharacterized membrane protein YfcA
MVPDPAVLLGLAALSSALGVLGGLGGAMFLVPLLLLTGTDPLLAAPLGAVSVVAGSLAAGPSQITDGLVHHRLGVTLEIGASLGAIGGALLGAAVPGDVITWVLAAAALAAAALAARGGPLRNLPDPHFAGEVSGEWPGTLAGSYALPEGEVVPYRARRVPAGLAAMLATGVLSGLAGVGGGFAKVPTMREVMGVPVKVAAATSTFTVGITASVAMIVFVGQGRVDASGSAAVVLGALGGGLSGSAVQRHLQPALTRRILAGLLIVVAVLLVVGP